MITVSMNLKMGKIALGVHKKSPNMAVRGEPGMYPLTIDIYARIVNYFFHLLELAGKGNIVRNAEPFLTTIRLVGEKVCYIYSKL